MNLRRKRIPSPPAAVRLAVGSALAIAGLLLMLALPVIHRLTVHPDHPEGPHASSHCLLCLHFDRDGHAESVIVSVADPAAARPLEAAQMPSSATDGPVPAAPARAPPAAR